MLFKTNKKIITIVWLSCFSILQGQAQNKTALFRTFNRVCSDYQRLPLQLELAITNTVNIVLSEKDTMSIKGSFDISKAGAFYRMNDQEEVVNDSMLLITDNKRRKMFLSFQNTPSPDQMLASFKQTFLSDSVSQSVTDIYNINVMANQNGNVITLTSKDTIESSRKPKEEIEAWYDPIRMEPSLITLIKRNILQIEKSLYDSLSHLKTYQTYMVANGKEGYYLIKETRFVTRFLSIAHKDGTPAHTLKSYLLTKQNEYIPTEKFKDYQLTVLDKL